MCAEASGVLPDPLMPLRPRPALYDPDRNRWVLSQYDDVAAALREPRLTLYDRATSGTDLQDDPVRIRMATRAALSAAKLAEWRARIEPLALDLMGRLRREATVDITAEFARPWSLATAITATEARAENSERLQRLARCVSQGTADPSNTKLQAEAKIAGRELDKYFERSPLPMGGPAFVALSQTLPAFLAGAWLALLRHPAEMRKLRNQPELMERATQELFRYAGLARKVSRYATDSVTVAGIPMKKGERASLLLASANRDPGQFPDPDKLEISRDAAGQLAFGAGPHACVAAPLVRMAAAIATSAFAHAVVAGDGSQNIEWLGGSSFQWPAALYVHFKDL